MVSEAGRRNLIGEGWSFGLAFPSLFPSVFCLTFAR